jgi:hypothetical protein
MNIWTDEFRTMLSVLVKATIGLVVAAGLNLNAELSTAIILFAAIAMDILFYVFKKGQGEALRSKAAAQVEVP